MVFKLFSHLMYAFLKIKGEFRAKYNDKFGDDERIRSAYLCIRKLSSIWSCYLEHMSTRDGIWGGFNDFSVFGAFIDIQKLVSTVTYDIKAGTFLISHPLAALHYKRSVILLLQHDNTGSQGIVINHQCEQFLLSVVENLPSTFSQSNGTLNFGGTVARLTCVHNCYRLGGEAIPHFQNIWFHGVDPSQMSNLMSLSQEEGSYINFFFGSCVWAPFELKNQIDSGFWLPVETRGDIFFDLVRLVNKERILDNFHISDVSMSDEVKCDGERGHMLKVGCEITTIPAGVFLTLTRAF